MKKHLLTLIGILSFTYLYAQKVEVSLQANTGLFNYAGVSSTSSSIITQSSDQNGNSANYTNNPYGNKKAFSYELAVQTQYVTKGGLILGLQTGYDILRSRTDITGVYPFMYYLAFPSYYLANPSPTPATGATYLQDKFINLNPYIGYRLNLKKIKLDILPGIDIGFNISSYDKGKAVITNYGTTYYTDFKRVNATNDVRVKLGVVSSYKKFGLNVSYAYGLTNYEKGVIGDGPNNVQSRLIRFGISYRLL